MYAKNSDWDPEELIPLVAARKPIYDTSLKDYNNRAVVDKLWQEIGDEMGRSAAECKNKWATIRNCYAREIRKSLELPNSRKKKRWYLSDAMSFLKEHMQVHALVNSTSSFEDTENQNSTDYSEEFEQKYEISKLMKFDDNNSITFVDSNAQIKSAPASTSIAIEPAPTDNIDPEQELTFFRSLLPDITKLSAKRRRRFKETTLMSLNRLLDEEEEEAEKR